MKKVLPLAFSALLFSIGISAQEQFENPGFEVWEDILASEQDTIREPVDWSSLKTSDNPQLSSLSPDVCKRSNNAHTGKYSLELSNVKSFLVVNGVATNGRMHPDLNTTQSYMFTDTLDDQWHTPFTARPDSITGWYNYSPQDIDTFQIKVVLHHGFGKQPDPDFAMNWIAMAEFRSPRDTEGEWLRFSAPFSYFSEENPEYVLAVLNSGAGFQAVAGSVLLLDDLELIYNSPQSLDVRTSSPEGLIYVAEGRQLGLQDLDHTKYHTVRIHDMAGKQVWKGKLRSDKVDITSAQLKPGIYLVNLYGESQVFAQKILLD
jgi:hypothetical protein